MKSLRRHLRRFVPFVVLGCLLGATLVGATFFISIAPASASCTSQHANVAGYDANARQYGNRGKIYVNTSTVIDSLHNALFRSLFAYASKTSTNDDVEVGWTADNGGRASPTVYAEWVIGGTDSGPQYYTGYSLATDSNYTFKVENVGHIYIWQFYVDSQTSPFTYSPTTNQSLGWPVTNSEHYNSCDSLWTHMDILEYFDSSGNWSSSYGDLECWLNTSAGWYLYKNSNSELHVYSSSSGALC